MGKTREELGLSENIIKDRDLAGTDLSGLDFSGVRFYNCNFDGAFMDGVNLTGALFTDCSLKGVKLTNAKAESTGFSGNDLCGSDFSGTDFYYASLDRANLEGVITDSKTQWFANLCPKEGPFIAWKIGAEGRVMQLLVPADARRVCGTKQLGRCDLAKVLEITNIDRSINYDWAESITKDDFIYERGKFVRPANGFQDNGWIDDGAGIYFFMERDLAIAYGTGIPVGKGRTYGN